MRFELPEINHSKESFEILAYIYDQTADLFFDDIVIDMKKTKWFEADMCAVFGAILHSLTKRLNSVNLINLFPDVEEILSKNGFLSHYGGVKIPDHWGTTITYHRFDPDDDHYFASYIQGEFIHRSELPRMSKRLLEKFRQSVYEIFGNAVSHSRTESSIFSCGQYYPKKHQLDFTVADLGVGIRHNVNEYTGKDYSSVDAIVWATEGNSTTRQGDLPGGLGLKLLCDFIQLNSGSIRIVSDTGYWCRRESNTEKSILRYPFPGTVVILEINTADQGVYHLTSEEIDPDDIF